MARNDPDQSRNGQRVISRRIERRSPPPERQTRHYDRRKRWVQIMAGLLVLAMLLPVLAGIISALS